MTQYKGGALRQGLVLNTNEEHYQWFTQKAREYLRLGFMMNLSTDGGNMMLTDDPAEAKAACEALWGITKEAEKKVMDEQEAM